MPSYTENARCIAMAEAKGIIPRRDRWASVRAAADAYVLRETRAG
ncbi:hypothetical protein AB0D60_35025 [Streptomyces sp. NPDC048306]